MAIIRPPATAASTTMLMALGLLAAGCSGMTHFGHDLGVETASDRPGPALLQDDGVLYVRSLRREERLGVSLVRMAEGGAEEGALTTVFEAWLDPAQPWRFRRESRELLDGAARLSDASGSDGTLGWWKAYVMEDSGAYRRFQGRPPLLEGAPPGKNELTMLDQLRAWVGDGQGLLEGEAKGTVQRLTSEDRQPWGTVITLTQVDPRTGQTTTSWVRAEAPHLVVEQAVVDAAGRPFSSKRITDWKWIDADDLGPGFWMEAPEATVAGDPEP